MSGLVNAMDSVGADVEKIEAHIAQQKAICEEVAAHKPDLDDLIISGQAVMKHCTGEDGPVVQVKIITC